MQSPGYWESEFDDLVAGPTPHHPPFPQQSTSSFPYTSLSDTILGPAPGNFTRPPPANPSGSITNLVWTSGSYNPTPTNLNDPSLRAPGSHVTHQEGSTWANNPQFISPAAVSNSNNLHSGTHVASSQPGTFDNPLFGTHGSHYYTADHKSNAGPYVCQWKDCRYPGTFRRESDLMRHLKRTHVSPGSFPCHVCGRLCNREDNRQEHMRRRHKDHTSKQ